MCGITLSIYPISSSKGQVSSSRVREIHDSLAESNARRGPNVSSTFIDIVNVTGGQVELRLTSSVLGLRGELTGQPVVGKRGVLAWNGQVFHGLDIKRDENDTMAVFRQLEAGADIHKFLASIEGPYAFVYYEFATQTLTYQLDLLSRRALLQHLPSTPTRNHADATDDHFDLGRSYFALSSTRSPLARRAGLSFRALGGGEGGSIELGKIRLRSRGSKDGMAGVGGTAADQAGADVSLELDLHGALKTWESHPVETGFTRIPPLNTTIPPPSYTPNAEAAEAEVDRFIDELTASVMRRVNNIPPASAQYDSLETAAPGSSTISSTRHRPARAALLFSGGVDSTLLAYMLHKCLPPDEPIDLVNVAFQRNPDLPSDQNQLNRKPWKKVKGAYGRPKPKPDSPAPGKPEEASRDIEQDLSTRLEATSILSGSGAVAGASGGHDGPSGSQAKAGLERQPCAEAVLPSDESAARSTVPIVHADAETESAKSIAKIASLEDSDEPEKPPNGLSTAEHAKLVAEHDYNVPDRLAGHEAVEELRRCCPGREFRFVLVNVTYPSLAYPLYFASRGIGTVDGEAYHVIAKVYFSGLGPDEQLGGYSRHRHAYLYPSHPGSAEAAKAAESLSHSTSVAASATTMTAALPLTDTSLAPSSIPIASPSQNERYTSLLSSLTSELSRLPTRNTSRDDRALSTWARDARYPYLDLQFVAYLSALPVHAKVVYELGEGIGDKLLLRLAAKKVGLEVSAKRVKRAMQFGSRSAKVGGKGKGPGAGRRVIGED